MRTSQKHTVPTQGALDYHDFVLSTTYSALLSSYRFGRWKSWIEKR
jgi:hypothetical protein